MTNSKYEFIQGNIACAKGAAYAGCNFFGGYPITPSTEIAEFMAEYLPQNGGKFIQMEDEIASIGSIIGASLTGAKAMTSTSGPGFSLMQELIGYACIAEVPVVIVNVMRGGPSTGLPTSPAQSDLLQAKWGTHGDHPTIALIPNSVEEMFTETVRAFNLAEYFRTPVIILGDEIIGHMRERIRIPEPGELEIINRTIPNNDGVCPLPYASDKHRAACLPNFGKSRFHVTGLNHDDSGFPTMDPETVANENERIISKVYKQRNLIDKFETVQCEDAKVLLLAVGSAARAAEEAVIALREKGVKAGLFRPVTLWPFPKEEFSKYALNADFIVVPEMNLGQLKNVAERFTKRTKIIPVNLVNGEPLGPESILSAISHLNI
ncbi:MAG TPA: 2-oxoacid:acceptor oxidoreductase subunit alpha [bacterium]|nr:2-oxoacid:acceptor oxidoreductase subunit alpha [bacterium]HPS30602.1 2-oxoacid:acceptor oxidoreductase subunit alpha [bacterium]